MLTSLREGSKKIKGPFSNVEVDATGPETDFTRKNVYEKLMKTPSNPQFSPFGPIKCREKTLIQSFSILKCVLGVPDHTGTLQK